MPQTALFARNMNALQKRYPRLAERVKDLRPDAGKYRFVRARNGQPNLLVADDHRFQMLYDPEDPWGASLAHLKALKMNFVPIAVFLGLGLGYHLHLFTRNFAERLGTKKILVFEENRDFLRLAVETIDLSEIFLHPDVQFFVGEDIEEAYLTLRQDVVMDKGVFNFMKSTKVIPLAPHVRRNPDYYRRALDVTKRAFSQTMIMAGNDPIDSFIGMDNLLMNIRHIVNNPGINRLFGRFQGLPAVTVGAGPSLNKNIHLIQKVREKALIICCDASFKPLMKRNIRPHLVVSLERTDGTEYFFDGVPDFEDIYLAICPLIRPQSFDSFRGEKIIVHRTFSHFNWLHLDKGALAIGPCVGNMAYKVAHALGCDPIIMIGQDLAFAADGDTHVKDMPFGERDENYHEKVLEVEGNDGKPIKTSRAWDIFRGSYEEDIRANSGITINATEGGARIRGARIMTFQEAIDGYCREDRHPLSIIKKALAGFRDQLNAREDYEALLKRIDHTHAALDALTVRFQELLATARAVQRDQIVPFINSGAPLDRKIVDDVIERFLVILNEFLRDQDVNDIMLHTLQPHGIWFSNKFNFLPDLYTDGDCRAAAQVLMVREWLGVTGQLFVSTMEALAKGRASVIKDLQELQSAA
ncbi:MAG TPA: DUF115 domain-containing protein [Syntrophales bacterium]|nr:DUF115 domain-containing protein [Syntrophales bacterium]